MSKRGQGEGSWRQRSSGHWEYRFRTPGGESGSTIRHSVVGATKEEVRRKADEIRRAAKKGVRRPSTRSVPTLDQWLTAWIDEVLPSYDIRVKTQEQYDSLLRTHVIGKPIGRSKLVDLRPSTLQALIASARNTRSGEELAPSSRKGLHAALTKALEQAVRDGILEDNPMRRVERAKRGKGGRSAKIRALDIDQIDALLERTADHRHDALVRTALLTGMRRAELAGLRWTDIDLDGRRITVEGQLDGDDHAETKTDAGERTIDIGDELADLLVDHGAAEMSRLSRLDSARSDLVFTDRFGQALDLRAISRWYAQRARSAGLSDTGLHALRHTAISRWLMAGIPISVVASWAGHSSPETTLRIYAWALPTRTEDFANRVSLVPHAVPHPLSIGA